MNRLISTMLEKVTPDSLPPIERQGPARVLFLAIHALGWRTFNEQLEDYAGPRADVDAVHIRLSAPTWMKVLNRTLPGFSAGTSIVHPTQTWRWLIGKWLRGALPVERFDVIHCSPGTAASAVARLRTHRAGGFKLSVSTDCTETLWSSELLHQNRPVKWKVEQEREIYSACDFIAPWCRWVIPSLEKDYGIAPEKMQVCHPAIPEADFESAKSSIGKTRNPGTLRQAQDRLVRLVFVGNDWERKGGPELLRWHQAHFANRAELHIVSGKAPVSAGARNVVWHGAVPHAKLLAEILPGMELFVFPTKVDMLPNVVIEAATFGLPSVTSRVAGIPELVKDGQTGFLCNVGDESAYIAAMAKLIDDPELRARMSGAAREFAEKEFTTASQFGPLFDRLVGLAEEKRRREYWLVDPCLRFPPAILKDPSPRR